MGGTLSQKFCEKTWEMDGNGIFRMDDFLSLLMACSSPSL